MGKPIIIKKYANRRLYNTQTSSYITLHDVFDMIKKDEEFEVVDAKTGEDLTHQVLTQLIFENNRAGELMPANFLKQLITFYDDSLQSLVPHYLEASMDIFTKNKENMTQKTEEMMKKMTPFSNPLWENIQKQNMEMLQKSMTLFNPFSFGTTHTEEVDEKDKKIADLEKEVEKLNQMVKNKK